MKLDMCYTVESITIVFQLNLSRAHILKQTDSVAEQDMHEKWILVFRQESRLLSTLVPPATERFSFSCGLLCLPKGIFNAGADKGKYRSSLFDQLILISVGEHKYLGRERGHYLPNEVSHC